MIEDHIRLRITGHLDEDLQRNCAPDVALLTETGSQPCGHDAVRGASSHLYRHGPGSGYEMVSLRVHGDFALLLWKANGPDYAVDCAADSFVVADGKIRMQTSHGRLAASVAGYSAGVAPSRFRAADQAS